MRGVCYTGSEDGSCRLWDVASGQCVRVLQHRGALTNAFFSGRCHHLQLLEQDVKLFRPSVVLTTPFEKKKTTTTPGAAMSKTSAQCLVAECPLPTAQSGISIASGIDGHRMGRGGPSVAGRQAALSDQVRQLRRLNHQLYAFAVDKVLPSSSTLIGGGGGGKKIQKNKEGGGGGVGDSTTPPSAGKKRRQQQHHQRSKSAAAPST